jgi:hypothetical protein
MPSSGMLRRVTLLTTTREHIPQDGILHSYRRDNLKSYKNKINSVVFNPKAIYTDREAATCQRS